MTKQDRINRALSYAGRYGGIDGEHHKAWVIDQMVRALCGCNDAKEGAEPMLASGYKSEQESNREYREWVASAKEGDDGPETYGWDEGTPP